MNASSSSSFVGSSSLLPATTNTTTNTGMTTTTSSSSSHPQISAQDLLAWRSLISSRHRNSSPLNSERPRQPTERRERRLELARRGEQALRVSTVSRAAFLGSCTSIIASSAADAAASNNHNDAATSCLSLPGPRSLTSTFGDAAMPQSLEESRGRSVAATEAMQTLQQASSAATGSNNFMEETDLAIDRALMHLSSAGYAFADRGVEGAAEAAATAEASNVLDSLKRQPTNEEDCRARFDLYERHAQTVATIRQSLLQFWEEHVVHEVTEAAPRAAMEQQIRQIDQRHNLELVEDPRYWFVYSMALATSRNESAIQNVLKDIQAKLVFLAQEEEDGGRDLCPICLEPIAVAMGSSNGEGNQDVNDDSSDNNSITLGCAHRLHADCWRNWSAHCTSVHKTPFCPTCRHEEFLEEIL